MDMKELKKTYGVTMKPTEATRAFKREMPFDHKTKKTVSYILINDNSTVLPDGSACVGSRTHINTYDGICGPGFNAAKATWALGDEKKLKKVLRGYDECPVEDCPVAVRVAVIPKPAPATPTQAPEQTPPPANNNVAEETVTQ